MFDIIEAPESLEQQLFLLQEMLSSITHHDDQPHDAAAETWQRELSSFVDIIDNISVMYDKDIVYFDIKNDLKRLRSTLAIETINDAHTTLARILRVICPFDLAKFLEYANKSQTAADQISQQDVVLLLGTPGSGKTTLLHYLAGSDFDRQTVNGMPHLQPINVVRALEDSFTSAEQCVETRYLKSAVHKPSDWGLKGPLRVVCDTPSFDLRNEESRLAYYGVVSQALSQTRRILPVFLISHKSIGDRLECLADILGTVEQLVCDEDNLYHVMELSHFIWTKIDEEFREQIPVLLTSKLESSDSPRERFLIERMLDSFKQVPPYDPLNKDKAKKKEFARFIKKSAFIETPAEIFGKQPQDVIADQFRGYAEKLAEHIAFWSSTNQAAVVEHKKSQLVQVLELFRPCEFARETDWLRQSTEMDSFHHEGPADRSTPLSPRPRSESDEELDGHQQHQIFCSNIRSMMDQTQHEDQMRKEKFIACLSCDQSLAKLAMSSQAINWLADRRHMLHQFVMKTVAESSEHLRAGSVLAPNQYQKLQFALFVIKHLMDFSLLSEQFIHIQKDLLNQSIDFYIKFLQNTIYRILFSQTSCIPISAEVSFFISAAMDIDRSVPVIGISMDAMQKIEQHLLCINGDLQSQLSRMQKEYGSAQSLSLPGKASIILYHWIPLLCLQQNIVQFLQHVNGSVGKVDQQYLRLSFDALSQFVSQFMKMNPMRRKAPNGLFNFTETEKILISLGQAVIGGSKYHKLANDLSDKLITVRQFWLQESSKFFNCESLLSLQTVMSHTALKAAQRHAESVVEQSVREYLIEHGYTDLTSLQKMRGQTKRVWQQHQEEHAGLCEEQKKSGQSLSEMRIVHERYTALLPKRDCLFNIRCSFNRALHSAGVSDDYVAKASEYLVVCGFTSEQVLLQSIASEKQKSDNLVDVISDKELVMKEAEEIYQKTKKHHSAAIQILQQVRDSHTDRINKICLDQYHGNVNQLEKDFRRVQSASFFSDQFDYHAALNFESVINLSSHLSHFFESNEILEGQQHFIKQGSEFLQKYAKHIRQQIAFFLESFVTLEATAIAYYLALLSNAFESIHQARLGNENLRHFFTPVYSASLFDEIHRQGLNYADECSLYLRQGRFSATQQRLKVLPQLSYLDRYVGSQCFRVLCAQLKTHYQNALDDFLIRGASAIQQGDTEGIGQAVTAMVEFKEQSLCPPNVNSFYKQFIAYIKKLCEEGQQSCAALGYGITVEVLRWVRQERDHVTVLLTLPIWKHFDAQRQSLQDLSDLQTRSVSDGFTRLIEQCEQYIAHLDLEQFHEAWSHIQQSVMIAKPLLPKSLQDQIQQLELLMSAQLTEQVNAIKHCSPKQLRRLKPSLRSLWQQLTTLQYQQQFNYGSHKALLGSAIKPILSEYIDRQRQQGWGRKQQVLFNDLLRYLPDEIQEEMREQSQDHASDDDTETVGLISQPAR